MKRLLFVDDSTDRWDAFMKELPGGIGFCTWAPTALTAIDFLRSDLYSNLKFDVICLDHDNLGANDACGCIVVDWIISHRDSFKDTQFIIHSRNPVAAEVMNSMLLSHGLKSKRKEFRA